MVIGGGHDEGMLVARKRRSWAAPVVLTVSLTATTNVSALAINSASSAHRWPAVLAAIGNHPFRWALGLTAIEIVLGVLLLVVAQRPERDGATGLDGGPVDFYGSRTVRNGHVDEGPVRQLPAPARDFTGRVDELAAIQRLLAQSPRPVVNIYGMAGTGKTTLALEIASRLDRQYGDCQLYFDLARDDVETWLGRALVWLGVPPSELVPGIAARAEDYRQRLNRRRPLILIDNAFATPALRDLLPPQPNAVVLITSWRPMTGLPGLRLVNLQPMKPTDSEDLLDRVADRHDHADGAAKRQVAELGGHLPLALRISAGMLAERPDWTWSNVVHKLQDRSGVVHVAALESALESVQRSFQAAYRDLDPTSARAFRRLGIARAPRMSRGLVLAAVASDLRTAQEAIDHLAARQLLRVDGRIGQMHSLLWSWARDLLAADPDASDVAMARRRVTGWALTLLGESYLDWLVGATEHVPLLDGLSYRQVSLRELYVDTKVVMDGRRTALKTVFPAGGNILMVGPGGSGKTTMINHLAWRAASARRYDANAMLPVLLFARDLRPSDASNTLETSLLRSLRLRADLDMPADALDIALEHGHLSVIIDGLDEVSGDHLRAALLRQLHAFARRRSKIPILVTSRPYSGLGAALPGFHRVDVAPWNRTTRKTYLNKLAAATRHGQEYDADHIERLLSSTRLQEAIGDPLGLQMAARLPPRTGLPPSYAAVMESLIREMLLARELARVSLPLGSPQVVRDLLEQMAFTMQTSTTDRTSLSGNEVAALAKSRLLSPDVRPADADVLIDTLSWLGRRTGIFMETVGKDGSPRFSFTHTAFREYLTTSYLVGKPELHVNRENNIIAGSDIRRAVSVLSAHLDDPSWESILGAVIDLGVERQGISYRDSLLKAAASHPRLTAEIEAHPGQRAIA